MYLFRAAFAAAVVSLGALAPAHAAAPLRLEEAFQRVMNTHPDLAVWRARLTALSAERDVAALRPALAVSAGLENALGTGSAAGFKSAELTLSLASVLERGGKREARMAVAARQLDATEVLRDARRIDLMAEVARRYLDVVVAGAQARLGADDIGQRERTLIAATQRVQAGGAPESVRLAALSAKFRAEGNLQRTRRSESLAKRRLALLWSATDATFDVDTDDFEALPTVIDYAALQARLEQNPGIRIFAHEARIREARLQLARTSGERDVDWQVGLRRLEGSNDWAVVGGVSVPMGSVRRAEPAIRAVQAELEVLAFEREGTKLTLEATLAEVYGRLDAAVAEASQFDRDLIPTLRAAETAAEKAYRRGALTYLEWAQLQSDTIAARQQRLAASVDAQRALIELQRLTGEPMLRAHDTAQDSSP